MESENVRPITIVIATSKGGSGKSTLAILLANEFAQSARVLLIDADAQRTSEKWFTVAKSQNYKLNNIQVVSITNEEEIIDQLKNASGVDVVLVDVQGTAKGVMQLASVWADLVVVPTRATVIDAQEAVPVVRVIEGAGGRGRSVPHTVVLNSIDTIQLSSPAFKAAYEYLEDGNVNICPVTLWQRGTYADVCSGHALYEIKDTSTKADSPLKKARANVAALAKNLYQQVISAVEEAA